MTGQSFRDAAIGLAAVTALRLRGAQFPPVVTPRGERSLIIGPTNSAGQAYAWARAVEAAAPSIVAESTAFIRSGDHFRFAVDRAVEHRYGVHSVSWQRRQFSAMSGASAVLLESGVAPLTKLFGGSALAQAEALRAAGVRVALVFHGSDIRDPDTHLRREPHSHFSVDPELTEALRRSTSANREFADRLGAPVFVSTPDLLGEVSGARWLPVVVDPDSWVAERPALSGDQPLVVAHAPSKSTVKGTDLIEPVLQNLANTIDYRPVHGVPHSEMPSVYGASDVVLDQFRVGGYGVAACEALAAGRLVVSHVADDVRQRVKELTGEDLPIVEATPETLAEVLRDIDRRREHYAEIAAAGARFAARYHDGRMSGRVIAEWMESI